jgi:hypothetical protein
MWHLAGHEAIQDEFRWIEPFSFPTMNGELDEEKAKHGCGEA